MVRRSFFNSGRRPSISQPPYFPAATGAANFSTRIAVALNSAVPDLGSVASIVRIFVATCSGKWTLMNASPGRNDSSNRTGASSEPRRELTRTRSPSVKP